MYEGDVVKMAEVKLKQSSLPEVERVDESIASQLMDTTKVEMTNKSAQTIP